MDLFLTMTVLFMVANMAVVVTMLRRVNLDNESVIAWEQAAAEQATPNAATSVAYQVVNVTS
ncbi:hypothetical protein QE250_15770 [Chromatiaceae bacterium AAb-1]|nr:hypothetical protein [Chromatiaceae bacterium AAb-1]